ncbi:hypothetical protein N7527_008271 [Penicillium freii]|nr:hypothetical protein N7527_008271 [Penicillium freii]
MAQPRYRALPYRFRIPSHQHTPLAMAADTGNIETVRLLLDRGADPDPAIPLSQKITERMIKSLANCTEEEAQKPIFAIDI